MSVPSVLWHCWLGGRKGIRPVKNWVVGCWHGYLGWGADLHMAQQMPLPLTISCSSKSRLVLPSWFLPFWYLLTRVVPDKFHESSKMILCVCVCVISLCLSVDEISQRKSSGRLPPVKGLLSLLVVCAVTFACPFNCRVFCWDTMCICECSPLVRGVGSDVTLKL